ncbi:uncharacterized protein LOC120631568 [Pararge aegeria]|uniref:Jg27580 protein n=1 Tax=Pararge aegeria aegeria TaxID=348720 RepID=A0A8S4SNU4_9NEOP|nr:uncharacterized protein LOC120631568 [Pararge aegeria]CAH2267397.1 jg27580 [Pararge aegeria aegeria]
MFKYLFFALFLYTSVEAYVGIIAEEEKPAKFADQEGCYLSDYDRMLQFDVPFTPQDGTACVKYTCKDTKLIHIEGCSAKGISDNCERTPSDLTQAFPDCCEKVRCTLPDGRIIEV